MSDSEFPRKIENRPALPRIRYRIGDYNDFRTFLLRSLDSHPDLGSWTYRGSDDPGIALLEASAVVGDVLTFYQEHYANELFLRTATQRQNIAELVRLLGYRLSPGLGGTGSFNIEVRGDDPVSIPSGYPIKASLERSGSAEFLSTESLTAYPELSTFSLYRPRSAPSLSTGSTALALSGTQVTLKEGDRILLGHGSESTGLQDAQIVVVASVSELHGQTLFSIEGELKLAAARSEMKAYKLGETLRHFGHDAPRLDIQLDDSASASEAVNHYRIGYERGLALQIPKLGVYDAEYTLAEPISSDDFVIVDGVVQEGELLEPMKQEHSKKTLQAYTAQATAVLTGVRKPYLDEDQKVGEVSLDARIDSLSVGAKLICQWNAGAKTVVAGITTLRHGSMRWGALTGESTVLGLDHNLGESDHQDRRDVRDLLFYEVSGPGLTVIAEPEASGERGADFEYYGRKEEAQVLDGRQLALVPPEGAEETVQVTASLQALAGVEGDEKGIHLIRLDQEFDYELFPHEEEEAPRRRSWQLDRDQAGQGREGGGTRKR